MLTFLKSLCKQINILPQKKYTASEVVANKNSDDQDTKTDKDAEQYTSKENHCDQAVSKNTEGSVDFIDDVDLEVECSSPHILTDCRNTADYGSNDDVKKSKACLNDSRRSQRKSSRVASGRIRKISRDTWHFDTSTPLKVKREKSKRLCAKVANKKILEIIDVSPLSSDEEDIEMDDSE